MEAEDLRNMRETMTYKEISELTGVPVSTLKKKASRFGISRKQSEGRLFHYNKGFFDKPNILNSYVAGLVASDGNIRRVNGRKDSLSIALGEKDKEYLEGIKHVLGYTGELIYNPKAAKTREISGKLHQCSANYYLLITSCKDLVDGLEKNWLITPKKTHTLKFPKHLSDNDVLSYIIGYIDGDGTIFSEKNAKRISIYCQPEFAVQLHSWLEVYFKKEFPKINSSKGIRAVRFSRKDVVESFLSFIDTHSLPVMERKWSKLR